MGELLRKGHEVHCIVRALSPENSEKFQGSTVHIYEKSSDILATLESTKPSVVFHLASLFLAEHKFEQIEELVQAQITFGTQLVDAMVKAGSKKLVTAGTSWQNFAGKKGVAACLYAALKEAFESVLRFYVDAHELNVTSLKLYDTYGPGDTRKKLLSLLRESWREKKELGLSPGEQELEFLHVSDAVNAFIVAAQNLNDLTPGLREFYLTSGERKTLKDLVKTANEVLPYPIPCFFGARPYRAREVMNPWNEGPNLPNWKPNISLKTGLKSYFLEGLDV